MTIANLPTHTIITTGKGHGMNEQPLTHDMAEALESMRRTLEARARKEVATPEAPENATKPPAN